MIMLEIFSLFTDILPRRDSALRITLRGKKKLCWRMNFCSWRDKLYRGLSFCIQGNELLLVRQILWPARDYEIQLGYIDVRFLKDPGWGDYLLFWESWCQCLDCFHSVGSVDVTRSWVLMIMFQSCLCLGTCWTEWLSGFDISCFCPEQFVFSFLM